MHMDISTYVYVHIYINILYRKICLHIFSANMTHTNHISAVRLHSKSHHTDTYWRLLVPAHFQPTVRKCILLVFKYCKSPPSFSAGGQGGRGDFSEQYQWKHWTFVFLLKLYFLNWFSCKSQYSDQRGRRWAYNHCTKSQNSLSNTSRFLKYPGFRFKGSLRPFLRQYVY